MTLNEQITALIEAPLQDMGFEIVRVRLSGHKRMTLQIMVDRMDDMAVSVDDCAEISHVVSTLLDIEDPIQARYRLEISSPGIDRPLTRLNDFEQWQGFVAKITMKNLIDGRRRFQGTLCGIERTNILIEQEGQEDQGNMSLPFSLVEDAKLVLNDHLLAASEAKLKAQNLDNQEQDSNHYEGSFINNP